MAARDVDKSPRDLVGHVTSDSESEPLIGQSELIRMYRWVSLAVIASGGGGGGNGG